MLWISASDDASFVTEIEQRTGLKAKIADRFSPFSKTLDGCRAIVLKLPVEREVFQEVLKTRDGSASIPLIVADPGRTLDESLVRPPMSHFHYITSEDPEEYARCLRPAGGKTVNGTEGETEEILNKWLVGDSLPMRELRALIRLVAPRNATVLISGETGTGKERVARAIHAVGQRSAAEMVAVNCGALPETLIEAELFGHTKGAFTGAAGTRIGRFEQAHNSTLFLDEVGEIPLALQARLLRVLQERELQRLGSSTTIKIDTRIIAATNVDLSKAVARKNFREDLYYRLNVVPIHVPPLRNRRSDIPMLANYFIEQFCQRENIPAKTLSEEAVARLMNYSWPGNVRQLEHVIEMAVTLSGSRRNLFSGDIELSAPALAPQLAPAAGNSPSREEGSNVTELPDLRRFNFPATGVPFEEIIGRVEKMLLEQALSSCNGNRAKAANMLGMKRTTLLYKMKALEDAGYAA